MATSALLPSDIVASQTVVHPALDWHENTLLMGIQLAGGELGVITSDRRLLRLSELPWHVCEQAGAFTKSPVSVTVAERFWANYGLPTSPDSAYALVNVPKQLADYYRRFVVLPAPWWADLLALWTLGTYVYPIFSAYPYLRISSPEPGCGKSLLGGIISNLSFNGEMLVSPTEANIFRLAETERGVQVWDEVENESNIERNRLQAMKSVLLNGYRAGAVVPRQERTAGGQFSTTRFHVFVPRVLIGLSSLDHVLQQRVIELNLHRRTLSDTVERYRPEERESEENELRQSCALFALSYCQKIARDYASRNLIRNLENQVGQAGRLVDDLLLPLFAVGVCALDRDERSRNVLQPMMRRLIFDALPLLREGWNEAPPPPPDWLVVSLRHLHQGWTPQQLADAVLHATGTRFSAEQMSRSLNKYGIRSIKKAGKRVFCLTADEIADIKSRYGFGDPEAVTTRDGLDSTDGSADTDPEVAPGVNET
jgi:hypothetical protein